MNNNLKYKRMKAKNTRELKTLAKVSLHVMDNQDVVINGLGFIKVVKESDIVVYTIDEKLISVRDKMI